LLDNFLISVAAMAVVLGFMILVHEFGHFAVAKLLGVRVEQFAIGFGKRLVGFRKGGTDYRINLLPLGGYVKMSGETPLDARTGDPGEFTAHPRWHRFLIAIAGPSMNIILAVVLMTGVYMVHYVHPAYLDQSAVVGYVVPNSPAAKAGIQDGDRIVRLGNDQNPTWEDVEMQVVLSPRQQLSLAVQRGGQILEKAVTPVPEGPDGGGDAGWVPNRPVQVAQLEPNMPAAKAGMRPGDVVVATNGQPIGSIEALLGYLEQNKTKPLKVTVLRDGQPVNLDVTPVLDERNGQTRYRLGFMSAEPVHVTPLPFAKAFARSVETNKRYSKLILELVEKMVQRKVSIKQFTGPIGIGAAAGQAARQPGWTPLLSLTALISLNLGIFNLLPIPILDGGLILLLFVEAIIRRDISQTVKERIYQAAFVFLLLIGVIVIYNDLLRTIPGLAGRLP
jgi:regulator of sigma E protease